MQYNLHDSAVTDSSKGKYNKDPAQYTCNPWPCLGVCFYGCFKHAAAMWLSTSPASRVVRAHKHWEPANWCIEFLWSPRVCYWYKYIITIGYPTVCNRLLFLSIQNEILYPLIIVMNI